MIKVIAGGTVLLGCALLGMLFALGYRKRVEQITELQNAIMQLEFDIDFLGMALCDSLEKVANNSSGAVSDIFLYISDRLKKDRCSDMQRLWKRALERSGEDLFITIEDKKILIDFSRTLGSGDREREKNNIKMALMRLKLAEDEARADAAKNIKMYRGLGFLAGMLVVIVLI